MNYSQLKVLFYCSKDIQNDDIIWGLVELGADVVRSELFVTLNDIVDDEVTFIVNEVKNYDYVFTQDFSVNVAEGCHESHVPYISWIYDSPQIALYTDYALYPENFIFSFDLKQSERLRELGVLHALYQPLAANLRFQSAIPVSKAEAERYGCDISFVGQLYQKESLNKLFAQLSEEEKNSFLQICLQFSGKWNKGQSLFNAAYDNEVSLFLKYVENNDFNYYHSSPLYTIRYLLFSPFITYCDRVNLLSAIDCSYKAALYTKDSDADYARTFFKGSVSKSVSQTDMYKIFKCSKLNINDTLRSIETGIPQRVFDIMGMGGAVISNYQPELDTLFSDGKDIIIYHDINEFSEKAEFYLNHEKALNRIRINGYNRIVNEFNYKCSLEKMFNQI